MSTIHRAQKNNHFTVLDNRLIRHPRLSYRAKAILVDILSNSDDFIDQYRLSTADGYWNYSKRHYAKPIGRDACCAVFAELEKEGFVSRARRRVANADGKEIFDWVVDLYEAPFPGFQALENQMMENQGSKRRPGKKKPQRTSSSPPSGGDAGDDDDVVGDLFEESSPPGAPTARPRAERDSWAGTIISELNEMIKDDVASISPNSKLLAAMRNMAKDYSQEIVELSMIWVVEGFSPMKISNPGGFLTGQLPDAIREYVRARNKEASRQGLDPEAFNLVTWCLDQQQLKEASSGAMDKIGKLLNKAVSTDSESEATSLFAKACEIYHGNGHVNFEQSSLFEPYITQVLEKALKSRSEAVFRKTREHCQSENVAQAS